MSCRRDSFAIFGEVGEDLVGGLDPDVGARVFVPVVEPGADVGFEVGDAAVDAAAEHLGGDLGEPALDEVEPGGALGDDQTVIEQVTNDLAGWRLDRLIWVVDRGFSSDDNLRYLTRGGGHWIAGEKMRDGSADAKAALARPGRYHTVRDNLRVKEVTLPDTPEGKRFIVCHNPAEAKRDRAERQAQIDRISEEIARLESQRQKAKTDTARRRHSKAECELRAHPTLSRYLRDTPSGRPRIDRAKVAAEQRLDGKFLISTSDPHISAEDAALGYKNLLEAERSFRDLKGTLRLRPVFHRLEQRIRAHILICWLALLLVRVAERQAHDTWRNLRRELERLHLVTLQGDAGRVCQTTELTPRQREILHQLQLEPPPRLTSLTPAAT